MMKLGEALDIVWCLGNEAVCLTKADKRDVILCFGHKHIPLDQAKEALDVFHDFVVNHFDEDEVTQVDVSSIVESMFGEESHE